MHLVPKLTFHQIIEKLATEICIYREIPKTCDLEKDLDPFVKLFRQNKYVKTAQFSFSNF